MGFHTEKIKLIQAARRLLEEEKAIFASEEDCSYFREIFRRNLTQPSPIAPPRPAPQAPSAALSSRQKPAPEPSAPIAPPPLAEPKRAAATPQQQQKNERFDDVRSILAKVAPRWTILDQIPSDEEARFLAQRWQTNRQIAPFMIFFLNENPAEIKLLQNIAKALGEAHVSAAQQFEQAHQWPSLLAAKELKLIMISGAALKQLPNLLTCYRKTSAGQFLLKTPLLLLPEVSSFFQNPLLKRSLWDTLKKYAPHS